MGVGRLGGREEGREEGRKGGREEGRKGGREVGWLSEGTVNITDFSES